MTANQKPIMPLNAFKMTVKNIGGKLYRINNMVNVKKLENVSQNNRSNMREFKNVNNLTKKFSKVLSDDDGTSEEEYSNNISYVEDESEVGNMSNNNGYNKSMSVEDFEDINIDLNDVDSFMLFSGSNDTKPNNYNTNSTNSTNNKSSYNNKINTAKNQIPKFKWTHFLSIPLHNNKEFIDKFEFFKNKIIEENFSDIDESLFQKKTRLHMTLCLFRIEENKQKEHFALINRLIKESEESIKKILDGNPLYIDFDGLEIMGTPSQTRVLYTRPHISNSEKLRDIIDVLINKFIESNIITEEMRQSSHLFFNDRTDRYENEKLHLTLLNSTFLIREGFAGKGNNATGNELSKQDLNIYSKSFFNGLKIIKRMKNFSFGVHKVDEIILNEMRIDKGTDSYKVQEKFKLLF